MWCLMSKESEDVLAADNVGRSDYDPMIYYPATKR